MTTKVPVELSSTPGIVDSSNATAITIDSSENSTFAGNIVKGNLTISGTEIDLSSGDLTLDVAGEIILDADGAVIKFQDGGTDIASFLSGSQNLNIRTAIADKDIRLQGYDGDTSTLVTALTLDMSEGGAASFNKPMTVNGHTNSLASIFEANANGDTVPVQLKVKANNGTTSTQGLYGNAGSASTDNTIVLGSSGTSGVAVDSSGRALIGTQTSPNNDSYNPHYSKFIQIGNTYSSTADGRIAIGRGEVATSLSNDDLLGSIYFTDLTYGDYGGIQAYVDSNPGSNDHPSRLVFRTTPDGAAVSTEKMQIESSGDIRIGASSALITSTEVISVNNNQRGNSLALYTQGADQHFSIDMWNTVGGTCNQVQFRSGGSGTVTGTITSQGNNSTQYNTSSDYRLKENVNYTWDATTRLKQLKPAQFNWISDETNTAVDGFLAHEVSTIVPQAVTGEKDATETITDLDGKEKVVNVYQGIDHSVLVPLLVKTIQELEARIATLEG